jgi:KDO2-lipid IV(A) lauroyltransferase
MWNALAQQKGSYVMCFHMGNWELMCSTGTKYFAPVHVVVKNIGKGAVGEWVKKLRTHIGFFIIDRHKEKNATVQIFETLEKNHIAAFMADQRRKGRGEKIPFFGVPCFTNDSLMKLWLRRPAPIIPVYIHRIDDKHHEMVYLPEFKPVQKPEWSQQETIKHNTLQMNLLIEQVILKYPEEYFWMHNRWKD